MKKYSFGQSCKIANRPGIPAFPARSIVMRLWESAVRMTARGRIHKQNNVVGIKTAFAAALLISAAFVAVTHAQEGAERSVEPSFCELAPPESVQQEKTNFTEMFRFKLSDTGAPLPAVRLRGEFINASDFSKCVRTWKFHNFAAGDSFLIALRWEHPEGWTELRITSKDYSATFPKRAGN